MRLWRNFRGKSLVRKIARVRKLEVRKNERRLYFIHYLYVLRQSIVHNPAHVIRSVRKGSWFSQSHLSICNVLRVTRCWFLRIGNESLMQDVKVSEHAVVDWCMFFMEVCMTTVIDDSVQIGGEGMIVQVDKN